MAASGKNQADFDYQRAVLGLLGAMPHSRTDDRSRFQRADANDHASLEHFGIALFWAILLPERQQRLYAVSLLQIWTLFYRAVP
jgi:hypothetical protein